jgi:hypothetical protein
MMSTAPRHASDEAGAGWTRWIVVAVVLALVAGGGLIAVTSVQSYTVSPQVQTAYAIWDDTQLVVFVHRSVVGRTSTLFEQLRSAAAARVSRPPAPRWTRWADVTTVVRYENGVVDLTQHVSHGSDSADGFLFAPRPRFVEGRALVVGGFWNGTSIERLPPQQYVELTRLSGPEDMGQWHAGPLLQIGSTELAVQVRGEAATLRESRNGAEVFIDLVRGRGAPVRLLATTLGPHFVSQREYESILQVKRSDP